MAYLYLEPYLLNKMVCEDRLFSSVLSDTFKNFILTEEEKKRLIFDLKNILKAFQKWGFLELNIFKKYKRNSDEFFFNIVTMYHVKRRYHSFYEMHEFYMSHFRYTFDEQEKQFNFNLICSMYSNFSDYYHEELFPLNYNSMVLEIPFLIYNCFCDLFSKEEIENLSHSFWNEMNDFYHLSSNSNKVNEILNDESFDKIKVGDEILIKNKGKDKRITEFLKNNILTETSYGLEVALSNIQLNSLQPKVFIYNSSLKSFTKRILEKEKNWNLPRFVECFDNEILYNKAIDLKNDYDFKSYQPILSKIDSVNCKLVENEFDFVISISGGSCISYNDKESNILPSLTLTKIRNDNKKVLEDLFKLSSFVKKDGYLLFYSDSIVYEQSLFVKDEFLKNNKDDFEFLCGRYILPDEVDSRSCYYCIFRRNR